MITTSTGIHEGTPQATHTTTVAAIAAHWAMLIHPKRRMTPASIGGGGGPWETTLRPSTSTPAVAASPRTAATAAGVAVTTEVPTIHQTSPNTARKIVPDLNTFPPHHVEQPR
ncbi:hypothetical protein GCM10027162_12320 [Streptomyces incanus]